MQVWEEIGNVFKISVGKLMGKDDLEDLDMDVGCHALLIHQEAVSRLAEQ